MGMTMRWEESGFRARALSTRPVQIADENQQTRFTRGALEDMARQVSEKFVAVTIEHLDYLPPIGRWYEASVVEASDGEFELEMNGRALRQLIPTGNDPADPLDTVATLPEQTIPNAVLPVISFEARNFEVSDLPVIEAGAPFPMILEHRWSQLPPLIWTLSIPVVWGACKFAGSFLETLGKVSAEALAGWLRASWSRSKDPNRDRILSVQFDLGDGVFIYGFIPSQPDAADDEHTIAAGLRQSDLLAAFAGAQKEREILPALKRAAFIFMDSRWRLAWWTDGDSVFRTHWFDDHTLDPARFLGRPLLGDIAPRRAVNRG